MVEKLKEMKGPLTNADEVDIFLNDTKVSNELKATRLKLEMKFARDSSRTLPKSDRIFRIQVTLPNKKKSWQKRCWVCWFIYGISRKKNWQKSIWLSSIQ